MIKSVEVENHLGDRVKLILTRPDLSGFIVNSIDGLDPVKANINTSDVATNDGSIYNSTRLENRNIVISLSYYPTVINGKYYDIETLRHESYKYFPQKGKVTLIVETDTRRVKTEGYVETNEVDIFSNKEGSNISIICPDPYLYSVYDMETMFAGVDPMFEFEFSNESLDEPLLNVGDIKHTTEQYIVYKGDAEIGMSIRIHALGTASNVEIFNMKTREKFSIDTDKLVTLTGSEILAGDTIVINTSKNNRNITLIRDGISINILNCVTRDSKWFNLSHGDNHFVYDAETGLTNLQFSVHNRVAYSGV